MSGPAKEVFKNQFGEATIASRITASETVSAAGALDSTYKESQVSNGTGGAFAVSLAAPSASQDGQLKLIKAIAPMTNPVTMPLANVVMSGGYAPAGTTTLTFSSAGQSAVLIAAGGKWAYLGGSAVVS